MAYYIELIYSIFMFIIGTLFGSFFTLAIYRIPRKQDIVKSRSYCPNCKHKLGFFDCFPILSYVSTIGRCKYCKKPISIRYPLIEFASGMVFLLIYLICGFSWQALVLVACYIYLFLVIGVDAMKKRMTEEEKEALKAEVDSSKKKLKKQNKRNEQSSEGKVAKKDKAGAINVDIIIAIVVFVLFFASTILVTRNYSSTLIEYGRKSNALNICLNKINEAKFETISNLSRSTGKYKIDDIEYSYTVEVLPYKINETTELDNARVIVSTVRYMFGSSEQAVSLKCVKVENNI